MYRIISFLLIFVAIAVNARQITLDEAQMIATEFFNGSTLYNSAPKRAVHCVNRKQPQSVEPYYIFNVSDGKGFIIISDDTRAMKILGYSDHGSFDTHNIPPQLKTLLEQYSKGIETIPALQAEDESWKINDNENPKNQVLLETANWGQGYPYNAKCPKIDGVQAPTGCVATAMAIIMKYHNWPEKTKGNYYSDFYNRELGFNFANESFDWDKIKLNDTDNLNYVDELSKLMVSAGISVDMKYNANESSAYDYNIANSLTYRFNYSNTVQPMWLADYTHEELISMFKLQLKSNMPFILSGDDGNSSGHTFVIDGYNEDNLFHVNWGWDGLMNGYFNIEELIINNINLKNKQRAIINIHPRSKEEFYECAPFIVNDRFHSLDDSQEEINNYFNVSRENISDGESFSVVCPSLITNSIHDIPNENLTYYYIYGLGHMDRYGNLKRMFDKTQQGIDYYKADSKFICIPFFQGVKFENDIEEGDYIQLFAKGKYGDGPWEIIQGANLSPSTFGLIDNKSEYSSLKIDIDDDLYFYGDFSDSNGNAKVFKFETGEYKLLKYATYHFSTIYGGGNVNVISNPYVYFTDYFDEGYIEFAWTAFKNEYNLSLSLDKTDGHIEQLQENYIDIDGIVYTISDENQWITSLYGERVAQIIGYTDRNIVNYTVPSSIKINNNEYSVQKIFPNSFCGSLLKHIEFNHYILQLNCALTRCANLESITWGRNFDNYTYNWELIFSPNIKRIYNLVDDTNKAQDVEMLAQLLDQYSLVNGKSIDVYFNHIDNRLGSYGAIRESTEHKGTYFVPGGFLDISKYKQWIESAKMEYLLCSEMYTYNLNKDLKSLTIKPLIDNIDIKEVRINGERFLPTEYTYDLSQLDNLNALEVVICYRLFDEQDIETTYTKQINNDLWDYTIANNTSGIVTVGADSEKYVKIYNLTGALMYEGSYSDVNLAEGIYIVVTQESRHKLLIK